MTPAPCRWLSSCNGRCIARHCRLQRRRDRRSDETGRQPTTPSKASERITDLFDLCVCEFGKTRERNQLAGRFFGDRKAHVGELMGERGLKVVWNRIVNLRANTRRAKCCDYLITAWC